MSCSSIADRHLLLWDYDISEAEFRDMVAGRLRRGRLDRDWAVARLLDNGTYDLIRQLLGWADLIQGWPRWRHRVRSQSRRRGLDFLVEWLPLHHPELLTPRRSRARSTTAARVAERYHGFPHRLEYDWV